MKDTTWGDLAKKIVYAGLGTAVFAKDAVKDSKLHREVLDNLLSRAERGKDEIISMVAKEVSKFLAKIKVSEELTTALKGLVIHLDVSIRFSDQKSKGPKVVVHSADVSKKIN